MSFEAWAALAIVGLMIVALGRGVAGPDLVMTAGLTLMLALGVVPLDKALVGFSSPAVVAIAALFVVAAALRETGAIDSLAGVWLGGKQSLGAALLRLCAPVVVISAFMNNTPVVAVLMAPVRSWCRRTGVPASKLLMPLSYASILGGTCTLIGSSTNLMIAGLARQHDSQLDLALLDLAWLGLPAAVAGILYIAVAAPRLLPERRRDPSRVDAREYAVAMRVSAGSTIIGKSIESAGLRHLPGLFLSQIERSGHAMVAVEPSVEIAEDDVLVFVGLVESVVDLRKIRGLVPATEDVDAIVARAGERRLIEAVVAPFSSLVGKRVRDSRFRTTYGAAIIAVHRHGERIHAKVGDIVLEVGDTLLLEAPRTFLHSFKNDRTFALVSEVAESAPPEHRRAPIAAGVLLAMLLAFLFLDVPLVTAALLACGALLATRCLNGQQARAALDIRVLVTIGAAFGIAAGLQHSGAAAAVGGGLMRLSSGPTTLMALSFVATATLASVIGNYAAGAIMLPIIATAADSMGIPLRPCILVLMLAASACFASPVSYPTNLMVLGPGGYRFRDYMRMGMPLQLLIGCIAVAFAHLWWF